MIILLDDFSEYQPLFRPLFFERKLYMQIYNTLVNIITWFFHMYIYILLTRKLYSARFITHLALCHSRLELKCNSFCTPFRIPARVAINNHSNSFSIVRNYLRLGEMNSCHSKTAMTLLLLWPLHIFSNL